MRHTSRVYLYSNDLRHRRSLPSSRICPIIGTKSFRDFPAASWLTKRMLTRNTAILNREEGGYIFALSQFIAWCGIFIQRNSWGGAGIFEAFLTTIERHLTCFCAMHSVISLIGVSALIKSIFQIQKLKISSMEKPQMFLTGSALTINPCHG